MPSELWLNGFGKVVLRALEAGMRSVDGVKAGTRNTSPHSKGARTPADLGSTGT